MEDAPSTGFSALAGEVFSTLFGLVKEIVSSFFEVLPKALSFFLWVLVAIFVLPCVFVASVVYPAWTKWGEEF